MWSEKRLQDVDKIVVLLRFKNQFHYYHVYSCEDTDFAFWKDIGVCPGTRQSYIYLCTLMVTKADVQAFMAERSEYTKANRFEDIEVKVYI